VRASVAWLAGSAVFAAVSILIVALDVSPDVRAPIVIGFVLVCPGLAIVRLVGIRPATAQLAVGVALSVALAILVPAALLYARAWSPRSALAILVAITISASAVEVALRRTARQRSGASARSQFVDHSGGTREDSPEPRRLRDRALEPPDGVRREPL